MCSPGTVALGFLALAALVLLAGSQGAGPRLAGGLFFVPVVVAPALWLAGRSGRPVVQWLGSGTVLALLTWQSVAPVAPPRAAAAEWSIPFTAPGQLARHRITLPLRTAAWEALWRQAAAAYVYICTHRGLPPNQAVGVHVNGEDLGSLGPAEQVNRDLGFVWYRLPVSRALVERSPVLEIVVNAPQSAGPVAAGPVVRLCGSYSHRPTYGPDASAFFDGARWHSGALSARAIPVAEGVPPEVMPWRYLFELRLTDARDLPTVAIFY